MDRTTKKMSNNQGYGIVADKYELNKKIGKIIIDWRYLMPKDDPRYNKSWTSYEKNLKKALNKLGPLEDIEEKIPIKLEKLFNAKTLYEHSNGTYRKWTQTKNVKFFFNSEAITVIDFSCVYKPQVNVFYYNSYNKTWSLTDKELRTK